MKTRYYVKCKVALSARELAWTFCDYRWFDSIEERDAFVAEQRAIHGDMFVVAALGDNAEDNKIIEAITRLGGMPANPGRAQNTDEVLMGVRRF